MNTAINALREAAAFAEIAYYLSLAALGRGSAVTREAHDVYAASLRARAAAEDAAGLDNVGSYYDHKAILARAWAGVLDMAECGRLTVCNLDQRRLVQVIEHEIEMARYVGD